MSNNILLGFEVGSGRAVEIPCRHMVVTGQTQEAGKTTTLEALISRSELTAVAFVTKRGEQSFRNARRIAPYFRERADWQFVASVLEATMRERLRFERAWIMRASKGARSLADVQENVRKLMETAKGLSADVYLTLHSYLEIVVPRIARVTFAKSVDLAPGLNVLDLSDRDNFPPELQSLVMRSVLEWIYEREKGVITIIPEAWEFIPQGRGSPVKLAAVELIRKGAGLRNYVWPDSQDIGGVDKELLRSCPVWLLGVQREANEIKRTLENIPAGIAKPKAGEIATLERGQFFACWGKHVIKTYVQPEWMHETEAQEIAQGKRQIRPPQTILGKCPWTNQPREEKTVNETQANELREQNERLREELDALRRQLRTEQQRPSHDPAKTLTPAHTNGNDQREAVEYLFQALLARLLKEPAIIELRKRKPEINLAETRETLELDGGTLRGRIAKMIHSGFFDNPRPGSATTRELTRTGAPAADPNVYRELDKLVEFGFLTNEGKGVGYQAVADMKRNIKRA